MPSFCYTFFFRILLFNLKEVVHRNTVKAHTNKQTNKQNKNKTKKQKERKKQQETLGDKRKETSPNASEQSRNKPSARLTKTELLTLSENDTSIDMKRTGRGGWWAVPNKPYGFCAR